ncbi:hypothetical protein CYFUS_001720 [Cystobacter fuscus]|uniref:Uncharacterized protein n=2 Tax=Cystobacter TaxID=42 RepID=A0A1L9B1W8_9BACT|nr:MULTISPECIES: hypothetical protein [Cystobacter]ATB36306.1 hypothetical protein CYFUS_001720 [Cystobacter fuscus]OJH36261.1 hypothetical protein BON30_34465 [Cystobacter ferrugineus]
MMKTLKVGLLGLALGVASAFVLPSQVAMAGGPSSGGAGGTTNPTQNTPPSVCQLRKALCLIENAGNPARGVICTAMYGNC